MFICILWEDVSWLQWSTYLRGIQPDEQRHHELRAANRFTRDLWVEKTWKSGRRTGECEMHSAGWRSHRIWPMWLFGHGSFETRSPRSSWKLFCHCLHKLQLSNDSRRRTRSGAQCTCMIPFMCCWIWFKLDDGFQSRSSAHDICVFAEVVLTCYVWCATLILSKSHAWSC